MKAIILAGGLGTRISEETSDKPKPMVDIFGKTMLWHIMSVYARQGINEFLIATGYKGEVIREWVKAVKEPWKITAVDTGLETQTGGRIAECMRLIPGERVFATYGDGLGNVNLRTLIDFHEHHGKLATITAVRPPARFGVLESENGLVTRFGEKNQADSGWINGGFFTLEPSIVNYIDGFSEPFESGALPRLVEEKQLMSFHHNGFWKPMDTLRERNELVEMAKRPTPPWLANLEN